jgi:hypothetical protein
VGDRWSARTNNRKQPDLLTLAVGVDAAEIARAFQHLARLVVHGIVGLTNPVADRRLGQLLEQVAGGLEIFGSPQRWLRRPWIRPEPRVRMARITLPMIKLRCIRWIRVGCRGGLFRVQCNRIRDILNL